MKYQLTIIIIVCSFSNLGYSQAKSENSLSETFCVILGLLEEYGGRTSRSYEKNLVEYFVPPEKKEAIRFHYLIRKLEKEKNVNFNVEETTGSKGHTYFYSKQLSNLINSYYASYTKGNDTLTTLDRKIFLNLSIESKYAYLKGVYERFGRDNEIEMRHRCYEKLCTVSFVLKSVNIHGIKLYKALASDDVQLDRYILTFEPSTEFKKRIPLNQFKSNLDLEVYKEFEIKSTQQLLK